MACASEKMFRMCVWCYTFVEEHSLDKCVCAPCASREFTESQMRRGIYACDCGYVGIVSVHACTGGTPRLVAKIADVDPSVTIRTVADCTAAAKAAVVTVGRIRIIRKPGDPDARVVCECRDVIHEERSGDERATKFTCGKCGRTCTFKDAMLPDPHRAGKAFEMHAPSHGCEKTKAAHPRVVLSTAEGPNWFTGKTRYHVGVDPAMRQCVVCHARDVGPVRDVCDVCLEHDIEERAEERERGQPSAVAAARGVAPMLCVDDPCGDDVAEEA